MVISRVRVASLNAKSKHRTGGHFLVLLELQDGERDQGQGGLWPHFMWKNVTNGEVSLFVHTALHHLVSSSMSSFFNDFKQSVNLLLTKRFG
jgi:hypothetical protein